MIEHINKQLLRMRRYRDYLWGSLEEKKIYLCEQKTCLLLYFISYGDMEDYYRKNAKEGIYS